MCGQCYFKEHEGHEDSGSIKSLLTREYHIWKSISERPDELLARYEQLHSKYSTLIGKIKQVYHKMNFEVDVQRLPFVVGKLKLLLQNILKDVL